MKYVMSILLLVVSATMLAAQDEPTPDPLIAAVMQASEPVVLQTFDIGSSSYSATVTVYPCVEIGSQELSYERLDVINRATNETTLVAEQLINCGGLGGFGLSVIHWSENGEFLYYTDAREGVPDGLVTRWVAPIYRVQLTDLQIERFGFARFSFNRQQLLAWTETDITVISTNDATETVYPVQPANLTLIDVMWLPDASGILYIQSDSPIAGSRSTVTHIDLETGEQTVLLDTAN